MELVETVKMGRAEAVRLGRLDAHAQAELLRRGEVSAAELIEATIARIEEVDPQINSISHRAFAEARRRAAAFTPDISRPLAGVPWLLKDSLQYPGMPTHAGSRSRTSQPATQAYPYARRYDEQGLIPVGMTAMPEFGLLGTTEPVRYGPTRNPWALDRSAGGSSGGAAAAVAAGFAPLAHASDAAGSIRLPAAACGVVGFKPSRGENVRARSVNLLDDVLCSDSLIGRSLRDVAWAFDAARPAPGSPVTRPIGRRLRIGVMLAGMDGAAPDPEIADVIERTARLCEGLGHMVEPVARPVGDAEMYRALIDVLWPFLGGEAVDYCRARWPERPLEELLETWTLGLARRTTELTPADLETAYEILGAAPRTARAAFANHDVILSPVFAHRPPPIGDQSPMQPYAALREKLLRFIPYTPYQNVTGTPAISLPLFAAADGLPLGSMFAADRGGDDMLLGLSLELEGAQPWADRWPAIVA